MVLEILLVVLIHIFFIPGIEKSLSGREVQCQWPRVLVPPPITQKIKAWLINPVARLTT